MNLLNREFKKAEDDWYQLTGIGEYPHGPSGLVQILDPEACQAMAARFGAESQTPNFGGLLVDFDHFSLDPAKASEAAGWLVALEARGVSGKGQEASAGGDPHPGPLPSQGEGMQNAAAGLWGKIRWSDVGETAVTGGRYRYLSPVWSRAECQDLGNGRVRPLRLASVGVTNDPNIKGLTPLSNRAADAAPAAAMTAGEQAIVEELLNRLGLSGLSNEAELLASLNKLPTAAGVAALQAQVAGLEKRVITNRGWIQQARAVVAVRRAKERVREGMRLRLVN